MYVCVSTWLRVTELDLPSSGKQIWRDEEWRKMRDETVNEGWREREGKKFCHQSSCPESPNVKEREREAWRSSQMKDVSVCPLNFAPSLL